MLKAGLRPILDVIDEIECEHWQAIEAAYILFYKESGCNLLNITPGGQGNRMAGEKNPWFGKKLRPETVAKMSVTRKGRKRPPFSPEWRAHISAGLKGRKLLPEHRANISAGLKGEKSWRFGKRMSPEERMKISMAKKGKKLPASFYIQRSANNRLRKEHLINGQHVALLPL